MGFRSQGKSVQQGGLQTATAGMDPAVVVNRSIAKDYAFAVASALRRAFRRLL